MGAIEFFQVQILEIQHSIWCFVGEIDPFNG
jgi:hypothetical protein